jgi:hypothetical protein
VSNDDRAIMSAAKPYIRSIAAFLLALRFGTAWTTDQCYKQADKFIAQLEDDLR